MNGPPNTPGEAYASAQTLRWQTQIKYPNKETNHDRQHLHLSLQESNFFATKMVNGSLDRARKILSSLSKIELLVICKLNA